jgi:hypothetical protein
VSRRWLVLAALVAAVASCGDVATTEALKPRLDGGVRGVEAGEDGTTNCDSFLTPILVVEDAATGEHICDASATSSAGSALLPLDDTSTACEYSVVGVPNGATVSLTVSAPSHASAHVTVTSYPCCGGPCANGGATVMLEPAPPPAGDAGDGDASRPAPVCPTAPPADGAACAVDELYCDYGDSPNPLCDALFVCEGSTWHDISQERTCPPLGATCPASFGAAGGCGFQDESELCVYATGTCVCGYSMLETSGPSWFCTSTTAGCPTAPPRLGDACPADTPADCDYGQCTDGVGMTCAGGHWALASVPCPA